MKITTDLTGNETAIVRQSRLKSVYDWYKGDGAYVAAGNLGVVRTAFNEYLASDIANLESFASWLLKFNLLNSPDTLIRTQLFGSGAKGVWFDPNDLPTLTQDSAGATPVTAAGQPVGRALDKSGNAAHATQAVAAKRPIYGVIPKGGRRNLLVRSSDVSNSAWVNKIRCSAASGAAMALYPNENWTVITENTDTGEHYVDQGVSIPTANAWYTCQTVFRIKSGSAPRKYWFRPVGVAGAAALIINSDGTVEPTAVPAENYGVTSLSDGSFHVWIKMFLTATGTLYFRHQIGDAVGGSYTGDGTSGFEVGRCQIAAADGLTPYQRVGSVYDITESGVPSLPYLASDLIDDELPATVPSLGINATVWFAVDGASTILAGQTVAAGQIATLRGARTYTMGAIDRPLTASETAALTTYLDKARGAL